MNSSFRRLRAIMRKEGLQILRDPSSILISVVLPTILMFIYGYGVSLDINHLSIGIALEDTSPDAQSFAQAISGSPYFNVTFARHRQSLYNKMTQGTIRGFVVVPAYFSAFLANKQEIAPIQVITDGSEPNTANFVQNYVQGAWLNWLRQRNITHSAHLIQPVILNSRVWYNEKLESRDFLLPGSLALIMALIGTLLTALVIAREWERGTMEALMATPITILELIIGKLVPYFFLGMFSMLLCTALTVLFYGVPFRGSLLALLVVSSAFLFSSLGMGLLISTLARNQFVASQGATTTAFLPALILSGFIFEISSMPKPIQWLTYLLPARYFVSSMKTLFLVGDVWSILLFDILWILVIALVYFYLTALKTAKRLD